MSAARPTIVLPIDASGATRTCVVSPLHRERDLQIFAAAIVGAVLAVIVLTLGGWL